MTDEQMQNFMRNIGELEEELTEANAVVYSGRLADELPPPSSGSSAERPSPPTSVCRDQGADRWVLHRQGGDFEEALSWAAKTSACTGRPIEVRPFVGPRGA